MKSVLEKLHWPWCRISHCLFIEKGNVRLKTGAVCDTVVFFVPSVAASWCPCAITQRRAACWLGSYAVPIWPPWTPTATLTPSSKCKSRHIFMNKQIMLTGYYSASTINIQLQCSLPMQEAVWWSCNMAKVTVSRLVVWVHQQVTGKFWFISTCRISHKCDLRLKL